MILVDTSVWIGWLRGNATTATDALERILADGLPFAITGVIYQEILQGADSQASFERLAEYFGTQRFQQPGDPVETHAQAAALYRRCREQGVTVRSTIDCLIAQLALEHELVLLHDDRDFERMQQVEPALRLYPG